MRGLCLAALLVGSWTSVVVGAAGAHAQAEVSAETRAVELFQISERLYSEGLYAQALEYLRQAHALQPSPTLLFNMARANEKLDRLGPAIAAYEDYLASAPHAPDAQEVRMRIETLQMRQQQQVARQQAQPTFQPPADGNPPKRAAAVAKAPAAAGGQGPVSWGRAKEASDADADASGGILPWVLVGAGVPVMGVGALMYSFAGGKRDDAVDEPEQKRAQTLQQQGESLMNYGNILLAVGAVVGAAGVTLLIVEGSDDGADRASVTPVLGPSYVGMSGRF